MNFAQIGQQCGACSIQAFDETQRRRQPPESGGRGKMTIGFWPRPSDVGNALLNKMLLFKKSLERSSLFCDQFEDSC